MKSVYIGIQLTLLSLLLFPFQAAGQQMKDYFPADTIGVGDTFPFSIVLNKDQSYDKIIFPDTTHIGGDFEIKNRRHYRVTDFTDSLAYEIQYFGLSDTTFPALPVHLINGEDTLTLRTRPAPLYFNSSLAEEDGEFLPLKPIYQFARNWWLWIGGLILALVAAWIGYRYYRRWAARRQKQHKPVFEPEPFVDPLDELQKELIRLNKDPSLGEQGDMKTFYTKLTNALRLYYERMYKIHAMESTTGEMMRDLRSLGLSNHILEGIHSLLKEADMVKFARFTVTKEHALEALDKTKSLFEQIRQEDAYLVERLRNEHEEEQQRLKEEFEGSGNEADPNDNSKEEGQAEGDQNEQQIQEAEKSAGHTSARPGQA